MFRKFIRFVILVCLLFGVCYFGLLHLFPLEYSDLVEKYSDQYDVPQDLVYAIIKAESNFTKDAVSHVGANGLMQLTDDTAYWIAEKLNKEDFSIEMVSEPEININFGVWYLSYLINEMHYTDIAILSYNAGHNKVKGWLDDGIIEKNGVNIDKIPYRETKIYLTKVKAYRKIYEILYKL